MTEISAATLEELLTFSAPSIANGIETFDVRPRNEGYMDASVRCMFPELGPLVGYATTATIRAREPGDASRDRDLWAHVMSLPEPRIVVVQDLDDPPGAGSYWGEVNSNIYQAFGAIGIITNGCVRDLDEMRHLRFHAFAGSVGVSHAYVHVVDAGVPVNIGGLHIEPGTLLHADQHGVTSVPLDIAEALPAAIRDLETKEQGVIAVFRSADFDPAKFVGDVSH